MSKNSIKKKITLNFNISLFVIFFILLITFISFFFIYDQYQSNKKLLFPILNISKDLEYLSDNHWNSFLYVRTHFDSMVYSSDEFNVIETKIDFLFNKFYDLYFIEKGYFLNKDEFSSLIKQLITIESSFRDYNFLLKRNINLIKTNNIEAANYEFLKITQLHQLLDVNVQNLNTNIVYFLDNQLNMFKKFMITFVFLMFFVSLIFILFYIFLWKKTVKTINLSFESSLNYLKKLLEKRTTDYSKLNFVELEIKEFVDLLKQSINQLILSEENLEKTRSKINFIRQDERNQIAQHLHDNFGQNITALQLENKVLFSQLNNINKSSKKIFDRINFILADSVVLLRQITNNLRIPDLKKYGLLSMVEKIIDDRNDLGITKFNLITHNLDSLPYAEQVLVIYQCIQEGVTNILKHAKANNAEVSVIVNNSTIKISILDDGIGMSVKQFDTMGISGMKESVDRLSGTFNLYSELNKGTRIDILIPNSTLKK